MKCCDIIKKFKKVGFELCEGGNYIKIYKDGIYFFVIFR